MLAEAAVATRTKATKRPSVSVYWKPGCSSCLKAKEFLEEHVLEFESVNVIEDEKGLQEVMAAGLRSVPVVRKGDKFVYAQSIDDVANLLGVVRDHRRLPQVELLDRWDNVLEKTREILLGFTDEMLQRQVIPGRDRKLMELSYHTFQVLESFLRQLEDDSIDARDIYIRTLPHIRTHKDLIAYVEGIQAEYRALRKKGGKLIPDRLNTHYGNQPGDLVLERGVWHSTQHARQLDFVAAGMGAELRIPDSLYAGLPLPKRLWA